MAVEPEVSPLITQTLAGQPLAPAPHKIQGIGANFVPKNLDLSMVDRVERVSNEESIAMARRLAQEEGILSGVSCGAAMAAALRLALRPGLRGQDDRDGAAGLGRALPERPALRGALRRGREDGGLAGEAVSTAAALPALVEGMLASYRRDPRAQHVNRRFLPSRDEILEIVKLLLELFYPGYFGRQDLTDENLAFHVGNLLSTLREKVERQVETCLCFAAECDGRPAHPCAEEARRTTERFLARLPAVRDALVLDVQAAYDGDPAASSLDEVILAYPGMLAVTVHRVAHELQVMGVPLMPRIMSEWAHSRSGADIHPGARIGKSFFIDHSTGVVVGETTTIGSNVKLYQGVTLGALSIPQGRARARHPRHEAAPHRRGRRDDLRERDRARRSHRDRRPTAWWAARCS